MCMTGNASAFLMQKVQLTTSTMLKGIESDAIGRPAIHDIWKFMNVLQCSSSTSDVLLLCQVFFFIRVLTGKLWNLLRTISFNAYVGQRNSGTTRKIIKSLQQPFLIFTEAANQLKFHLLFFVIWKHTTRSYLRSVVLVLAQHHGRLVVADWVWRMVVDVFETYRNCRYASRIFAICTKDTWRQRPSQTHRTRWQDEEENRLSVRSSIRDGTTSKFHFYNN